MRDFRTSLEVLCEKFHDMDCDHHESETYRIYYNLYYEIICGYLVTERDLRPLIANMIKQIEVRTPWAQGAEYEVLNLVKEELLLVMEKDPLTKHVASIY